jgi:4-carboxymuconolactone decarboxylase
MPTDSDGTETDAPAETSGADVLARFGGRSGSESLDSHPQLRAFFECWLDTFLFNGHVDPRLRELTILRVMWRCHQSFEWANHYRMARNLGVARDDIVAIRTSAPDRDLDGDVAVVVRAADDIVDRGHLAPDTYAAVREIFTEPGVLSEFLYLVAGYRMFASVSATRHNTAEDSGLRVWPPDGVGPSDTTP